MMNKRRYHAGSKEKMEMWQNASINQLMCDLQQALEKLGCKDFKLMVQGLVIGDFEVREIHGSHSSIPNRGWMSGCVVVTSPGHFDGAVKPYIQKRYSGWCPDNCNCCHPRIEEELE